MSVIFLVWLFLNPVKKFLNSLNLTLIISVTKLDNDKLYSVTVSAISTNGYEAIGEEQQILTPSFRRMQAFIVGSTVGLLILLAIVGITLYTKRHLFTSYHHEEKL